MSVIRYGIKLNTNEPGLINEAVKILEKGGFSYIELLINPNHSDITPFLKHNVEYVIHIPHENYGIDIGNPEKKNFTLTMANYSLKCADELEAKTVILHAGTGSIENAKNVLFNIDDSRIVIENMPKIGINGEACLGYDAEAMLALTEGRFNICMDFGHAVKAAFSLKVDYKNLISDLMKLEPRVYHISDGDPKSEIDNHVNIGRGSYDFSYFSYCISKGVSDLITLETPRKKDSLAEDLNNLRALVEKLRVPLN